MVLSPRAHPRPLACATLAGCGVQIDSMFSAESRKHSVTARHPIPSAKACFTGALVHFWKDAPFVRGGYTGPNHLEPEWARAALREPHARYVLFAGACCVLALWGDGAGNVQPCGVRSGVRRGAAAPPPRS